MYLRVTDENRRFRQSQNENIVVLNQNSIRRSF